MRAGPLLHLVARAIELLTQHQCVSLVTLVCVTLTVLSSGETPQLICWEAVVVDTAIDTCFTTFDTFHYPFDEQLSADLMLKIFINIPKMSLVTLRVRGIDR